MEYVLMTAIFYDLAYRPQIMSEKFPTVELCERRLEEIQRNPHTLPKRNIFGMLTTPTGLWQCDKMTDTPKGYKF